MPEEQKPPVAGDESSSRKGSGWFAPNQSGVGWHPQAWQGWLALAAIIGVIVLAVVLFRTGVL